MYFFVHMFHCDQVFLCWHFGIGNRHDIDPRALRTMWSMIYVRVFPLWWDVWPNNQLKVQFILMFLSIVLSFWQLTWPGHFQSQYTGTMQSQYTGTIQSQYTGTIQSQYTGTMQSQYTGTIQSQYTGTMPYATGTMPYATGTMPYTTGTMPYATVWFTKTTTQSGLQGSEQFS